MLTKTIAFPHPTLQTQTSLWADAAPASKEPTCTCTAMQNLIAPPTCWANVLLDHNRQGTHFVIRL